MVASARHRVRFPPCACPTQWTVEWGDGERGTRPAPQAVAELAKAQGYSVTYGDERTQWVRVVQPAGVGSPGTPVVTHVCRNCGFPTRVECS